MLFEIHFPDADNSIKQQTTHYNAVLIIINMHKHGYSTQRERETRNETNIGVMQSIIVLRARQRAHTKLSYRMCDITRAQLTQLSRFFLSHSLRSNVMITADE